jgi:hypothetical protein
MAVQSADSFANDLLMAAAGAAVGARAVVKTSAHAMKKEAQENVLKSAPVHNAGAHRTITYDEPSIVGARVMSEVGYDRDAGRAAALGNLLEYGGGGDKSPAHRDIGRAADSLEGRIGQAMQAMAVKLL